jgi:hypothetical protein
MNLPRNWMNDLTTVDRIEKLSRLALVLLLLATLGHVL